MKNDGRILIASAGILYGAITVGGSLLSRTGLSALDISFFFLVLSLIPLLPFVTKKDFFLRMRDSWRYLTAYSLANSGLVLLLFESVKLGVAPAISAFLLYTQPVWTIIFGKVFFSEKVTKSRIGVIVLALIGVFLITDPVTLLGELGSNASNFYGEIAALIGAVFLSLWIILGKKGRLDVFQKPTELVFAVRGSTLIVVTVISLATLTTGAHVFLANPGAIIQNIFPLFAFAIVAGMIPDLLFYSGIEKVQALQAGVILLIEPISSAILSVVLLISTPSLVQAAGGALILLSNYFINRPGAGQ
ncbi:MAG TPA: DMT family transporter [Nitrososphaerales archaeon]|nr:DMT family transporter [Nitrososphaerales archaeon]